MPNAITGAVTSITNGDTNGSLAACSITWFSISPVRPARHHDPCRRDGVAVRPGVPQADWPVLSMTDNNVDQDNCVDATLNLGFAGTASGS